MKKTIAMLLTVLVMMNLFCSTSAFGEEPFSLQGVTFGMSKEEVKNILNPKCQEDHEYENVIMYEAVPFSNVIGFLICYFFEDSLVAMSYGYEDPNSYAYLKGAMESKYGKENSNKEEFFERCYSNGCRYLLKMTIEEAALYWKCENVLISLRYMDDITEPSNRGIVIVYLGEIPSIDYNTDNL